MKEYWYVYQCSPSSEVRGRRANHDGGCGHHNVYSTNKEIDSHHRPQASPCVNCGRRQRLNLGNSQQSDTYLSATHTPWRRKEWAENHVQLANEARLMLSSNNDDASQSETEEEE